MPEHKHHPVSQQQPPPAPDPPPAAQLGDASASTDAAVHSLLAQRATHDRNGDKEAVAKVDAELAGLGVTAGG